MGNSSHHIRFHSPSIKKSTSSRSRAPREADRSFEKVLAREEEREGKPFERKRELERKRRKSSEGQVRSPSSEEVGKKGDPSLFDLAGRREGDIAKQQAAKQSQLPQELEENSLSALFRGYGTRKKLQAIQKEVASKQMGKSEVDGAAHLLYDAEERAIADHSPKKQALTSLQAEPRLSKIGETIDLAAIPHVGPLATIEGSKTETRLTTRIGELQAVAEQLIDKLYLVTHKGQTDTTISLQRPPLFKGARVVVSSFASAKGEFNIQFSGLTQAAKGLLDLPAAQDSLRVALEQKGYIVHIVTTSTWESASHSEIEAGLAKRGREHSSDGQSDREENEEHS